MQCIREPQAVHGHVFFVVVCYAVVHGDCFVVVVFCFVCFCSHFPNDDMAKI